MASGTETEQRAATVAARELTKRFGARTALAAVSFELYAGEVVAIIGPNGAGKTTLLSIMAGVLEPSEGEILRPSAGTEHRSSSAGTEHRSSSAGTEHRSSSAATEHRPSAKNERFGWVPQEPALYSKLSVAENLRLFARLERVPDPEAAVGEMLAQTELTDRAGEEVGRLSGGNQQRVNIAIGLLTQPPVLLLDEPSASLDPRQRERLWEFIGGLADRGTTIVFSTHNVAEAERYANRVLVLGDGELLFTGTPAELDRAVTREPDPAADAGDVARPASPGRDFETAFVRFLHERGH